MKQAAITIQKHTRRCQAIALLRRLRKERESGRRRDAAVLIQSAYRGYIQRQHYHQKRSACVVIQAHWRGALARRWYARLRWAVGVVGERYWAVRRGREVRERVQR